MDDIRKACHFERGLRHSIKKTMKAHRFQHYFNIVECAKVLEQDYFKYQVKKEKLETAKKAWHQQGKRSTPQAHQQQSAKKVIRLVVLLPVRRNGRKRYLMI